MSTALLHDSRFLQHDTGPGHPERSSRLVAAEKSLRAQHWFGDLLQLTPTPAEDHWLEAIHTSDYLRRARQTCAAGRDFLDSPDVAVCAVSSEIAQLAVGGALALADAVVDGRVDNGFALMRPPGHHAESSEALGFCLYNNVAIVARYLQHKHGIDKVLILDWDVHHGNGTQHSFESDPSVLYISLHQYPYYPGTGAYSETGIGAGKGATLNCPMPAGASNQDYEHAFTESVLPKIDEFKPDVVLLSAGFDAHHDDPLAQINLTSEMYTWMTQRLLEKAAQHANGRLISLLEGGYDLDALGQCVSLHVESLMTHEA